MSMRKCLLIFRSIIRSKSSSLSGAALGATAGVADTAGATVATGEAATGATVGAAIVDCGAASSASSGGGVGDWPSAVMARASQQKQRMSLSFIIWCLAVGCIESWTWIQVFLKTPR